MRNPKRYWVLLALIAIAGCSTYMQRSQAFRTYFDNGQLSAADKALASESKKVKEHNQLLVTLNQGTLSHYEGKWEESNTYFEQAYRKDDAERNNNLEAAIIGFAFNPTLARYQMAPYERLMVHYYMALNYINLKKPQDALVEVRRMQTEINTLNDKYVNQKHFSDDAFIHLLMGLVYESNYDYNNAFISYRNAYKAYIEVYKKFFDFPLPEYLKDDLIRTASLSGLSQETDYYSKLFNKTIPATNSDSTGTVIMLWENGSNSIKVEQGITFVVTRGPNGTFIFTNALYGWTIPVLFLKIQEGKIMAISLTFPYSELLFLQ